MRYSNNVKNKQKGNKLMERKQQIVKEVIMESKIEDQTLVDELWGKVGKKEKLTEFEHDYLSHCYHMEEARAGLL